MFRYRSEGDFLIKASPLSYCFALLCLGGLLLGPPGLMAQKYQVDGPIPPGATGTIEPIQGKVVGIQGLSQGVTGKAQDLNAALRDLGAKTTDMEIRIELSSDVLFDFDKADLLPKAIPEMEKVATILKSYPQASCTIEGYTDRKGSDPYNQKLSERRADSVKNWLLSKGATNPMTALGWGAAKPVAPNTLPDGRDNPDGRQKNRRVEIVVKKS
jgi:outer membrane protein OmpA-like peptidoglycan-associated protein